MSKDKAFEEFMFSEHGCDLHSKINCGDISAKRYAREVWQAATAESAARIAELENALEYLMNTCPPLDLSGEEAHERAKAIINTGDKT